MKALGLRWTIGDVAPEGFEALRFSLLGAARAFPGAALAVVVSGLPPEAARKRSAIPSGLADWLPAGNPPACLAGHLDEAMAEGVAWKLAPTRLFPDRYELSLDNDCVIWGLSPTVAAWLEEPVPRCLIAADVTPAFGAYAALAGPRPRNTGIRGFPPGYDLEAALARVLAEHPIRLSSELDEQGLQAVALDLGRPAHVVSTDEVSICSPFWPHQERLGNHGAHFVGLNAPNLPWFYYGRPARHCVEENWRRFRPELEERTSAMEPIR